MTRQGHILISNKENYMFPKWKPLSKHLDHVEESIQEVFRTSRTHIYEGWRYMFYNLSFRRYIGGKFRSDRYFSHVVTL